MLENLLSDRKMIERKYHDPEEYQKKYYSQKSFGVADRMIYHGYDYDETTGLDDAGIDTDLEKLSAELEGQPRPIHKAKLFAYVLDNTRIDIAEHDYFIGIHSWSRPVSKYTVQKWSDEVYASCPEASAMLLKLDKSGASFGWLDFDHTVPDWDSLMELGFSGILKRAENSYRKLKESGEITKKQEDF